MGCDNGNNAEEETPEETPIIVPEAVQIVQLEENQSISEYHGNGTVKLYYWEQNKPVLVLDNAGTITGGKLTLSLPATIPDEYLNSNVFPGVSGLPNDAKFFYVQKFSVVDGETTYNLGYEKYEAKPETKKYIIYFYSSMNVEVISMTPEEDWIFYLKLKKGWNRVYVEENKEAAAFTTNGMLIPSGMQWVLSTGG
jgi:hypothetical protein